MVEHLTVNQIVVGSSPTRGVCSFIHTQMEHSLKKVVYMIEENKNINNSESEDESLVKAFLENQSKDVFDWLVIKYQHKVFNICYRYMGNYHDANDCAQDTFIKVFRSLKNFRSDSNFSTWLYRIAVNTCKNKFKSLAYRLGKLAVQLDIIKGPSASDPSIEYEQSEKGEVIQKAIDALEPDHKLVIILRDVEGLSYEEVSEATGFNIGTVKSKIARARFRLQKKLEGLI
jgi:RNA polymerase sigma-70 factor, ECF subfamily